MTNSYCRHSALVLLLSAAVAPALTAWSASGARQGREPTGRQDAWAKYEIILNRNIFSRNRQPLRARRAVEEEPKPMVLPDPESYYILKGIVQEDREFIAFVEDKRDGSILRLRTGDAVARGTVKTLSLDMLEYEMADQVTAVKLGFDLQGGYGAVTATDLMEWSQTSTTPAAPVPSGQEPVPSADEADILKRLMEQRKQQLGQ